MDDGLAFWSISSICDRLGRHLASLRQIRAVSSSGLLKRQLRWLAGSADESDVSQRREMP